MKLLLSKVESSALTSKQRVGRSVALAALLIAVLLLRLLDPTSVGAGLPLRLSCGAVTGVPCIFCGLTRGLHFLLHGNFSQAIYFNWLAFPVLAGAILLTGLWTAELATNRTWSDVRGIAHVTAVRVIILFTAVIILWTLQVFLAISQHKHELLNPSGPLYGLFVR